MARQPNIVMIVADDLGYRDLGCYGSRVDTTPHIDAMAERGLRFTDFHANGPVCSPTRAALLTGRYQQRAGIENALGEDDTGLRPGERTVARCLRGAGYATAIFGKWHLGRKLEEGPLAHGFDEFRGHRHGAVDYFSHVTKYGDVDWWHNRRLDDEPGYCTSLITEHAVHFITRHRDDPFFLYVPHSAIHFPWMTPEDGPHRRPGVRYEDLSRLGPHGPAEAGGAVRRMIRALDQGVGEILRALRRLEIDRHTLVLFFSDNGGIREYAGGYSGISDNGPLRAGKGSVYEGGHRVPALALWPGRIPPGSTTDQATMTMDLFPTLASLASAELPREPALDGIDLLGLLTQGEELPQRSLFWRLHDRRAVRRGPWKLCAHGEKLELFNLADDVGETTDLAAAEPGITAELAAELQAWEKDVEAGRTDAST
jgi:arylsulfatase A-like enzyme